jgi:hypothetical protein
MEKDWLTSIIYKHAKPKNLLKVDNRYVTKGCLRGRITSNNRKIHSVGVL